LITRRSQIDLFVQALGIGTGGGHFIEKVIGVAADVENAHPGDGVDNELFAIGAGKLAELMWGDHRSGPSW
jgi:hypothetical protein